MGEFPPESIESKGNSWKEPISSIFLWQYHRRDITKILDPDPVTKEKEPASGGSQDVKDAEPQRKSHRILLKYWGPATDQFVKRLKDCDAPTQVVSTLRKLKTYLPSLKPPVPKLLKSNIVNKITCQCCHAWYIGKISRHTITRFGEHRTKKNEPV